MKNELIALEILLNELIDCNVATRRGNFLQYFKDASARVKDTLLTRIFASDSALKNREYIHYHQRAVIVLLDNLYTFVTRCPANNQAFTELIYAELLSIQTFLLRNFKTYVDVKMDVTKLELHSFKAVCLKDKAVLMRNLNKKKIDRSLLDLLNKYFKTLPKLSVISFEMRQYYLFVLEKLIAFSFHKGYRDYNDHLVLLLLRLNFNSIAFMAYCRNRTLAFVQVSDKKDAQLDSLNLYLKKINLIQLFPNLSLRSDYPNITTVLVLWIQEEKAFLENKKIRPGVSISENKEMEKIELGLSVRQLALFIRVLVEENIVLKSNLTKLLTFFILSFRTRNADQISFESLRNHYYDVENNTITGLKAKMIGIVNILNKMRG